LLSLRSDQQGNGTPRGGLLSHKAERQRAGHVDSTPKYNEVRMLKTAMLTGLMAVLIAAGS
jgi:hypothetical protein